MQKNSREECFDIMKGLAIIAVVAGHCECPFWYFTAFHLAVFMFVSGYFHPLSDSRSLEDCRHLLLRRFRQLSIPLMIISLSFTILHPLFIWIHWLDSSQSLSTEKLILNAGAIIVSLGCMRIPLLVEPLWFTVLAMFNFIFLEILRYVTHRLPQNIRYSIYAFSVIPIYAIGCILISEYQSFGAKINYIGSSCMLFPFFILGHGMHIWLSSRKQNIKMYLNIPQILIGGSIAVILLLQFHRSGLMWKSSSTPFLTLGFSLSGVAFTLFLSLLLERIPCHQILSYLGRKSYTIMVWHLCSFKLLASILFLAGYWSIDNVEAYTTPELHFPLSLWFCITGLLLPAMLAFAKEKAVLVYARKNKITNNN